MSFSDDLRATLAKKQASLLARQMVEERQLDDARRKSDETRRAAERLAREVFLPLLTEFLSVMEAAGVLCGGSVEEKSEDRDQRSEVRDPTSDLRPPTSVLCLRAAGTAPGSPHYEIRVASAASDDGRIDVTLECTDRTAEEFGESGERRVESGEPLLASVPSTFNPQPAPLLPAAKKDFRAANLNLDAARQWCEGVLKKCAEAVMEANGRKGINVE